MTNPVPRRRLLLGVAPAAVALIAACGPAGSQAGNQPGTTPAAGGSAAGATTAPAATAAPAAGKPVKGGTLTGVTAADVTNLDPARSQDVYSGLVLTHVVDTLFEIDEKGSVAGRLVEKSDTPQPNVYVWTLRKGIKFHDGTPFDSAAVKFNLERHINDAKSVRNSDVKDITSIETPDANTVKVTLKGPYAPFQNKLTGGAGYMLSPTAVGKLGDSLQRDLTGAGTGPYKFTSWQKDTQVTVDRNPDYWKKDADGTQLPYLDKIVYKPFTDENVRLTNLKTGDADILVGNPPYKDVDDLKKDASLTVKSISGIGFSFISLNTQSAPFNNAAVRRAFSYAIDRDAIMKTVFFGNGAVLDTVVPAVVQWAYEPSNHPYAKQDLAKAKQELQSAGVSAPVKFAYQIQTNSPVAQQTAELIKDQVKNAGLEMEIQQLEFATIIANGNSGSYQSLALGWSGGTDPDDFVYSLFTTGAGFNLAKYSNPDLDKLLNDGRATLDQAKRGDLYRQAQKILLNDQPFIIYWNPPQIATFRKNVQSYPMTYNGYWGARDFERVWKTK